jgi:hypothetical protein
MSKLWVTLVEFVYFPEDASRAAQVCRHLARQEADPRQARWHVRSTLNSIESSYLPDRFCPSVSN